MTWDAPKARISYTREFLLSVSSSKKCQVAPKTASEIFAGRVFWELRDVNGKIAEHRKESNSSSEVQKPHYGKPALEAGPEWRKQQKWGPAKPQPAAVPESTRQRNLAPIVSDRTSKSGWSDTQDGRPPPSRLGASTGQPEKEREGGSTFSPYYDTNYSLEPDERLDETFGEAEVSAEVRAQEGRKRREFMEQRGATLASLANRVHKPAGSSVDKGLYDEPSLSSSLPATALPSAPPASLAPAVPPGFHARNRQLARAQEEARSLPPVPTPAAASAAAASSQPASFTQVEASQQQGGAPRQLSVLERLFGGQQQQQQQQAGGAAGRAGQQGSHGAAEGAGQPGQSSLQEIERSLLASAQAQADSPAAGSGQARETAEPPAGMGTEAGGLAGRRLLALLAAGNGTGPSAPFEPSHAHSPPYAGHSEGPALWQATADSLQQQQQQQQQGMSRSPVHGPQYGSPNGGPMRPVYPARGLEDPFLPQRDMAMAFHPRGFPPLAGFPMGPAGVHLMPALGLGFHPAGMLAGPFQQGFPPVFLPQQQQQQQPGGEPGFFPGAGQQGGHSTRVSLDALFGAKPGAGSGAVGGREGLARMPANAMSLEDLEKQLRVP